MTSGAKATRRDLPRASGAKAVRSDAQRLQSQINGARSRGPKSIHTKELKVEDERPPEKRTASGPAEVILPGESQESFDAVRDALYGDWQ